MEQLIDELTPNDNKRDSSETLPPPTGTLPDQKPDEPQNEYDDSDKHPETEEELTRYKEKENQLIEKVRANIRPTLEGKLENMLLVKEIQKRMGKQHVFQIPPELDKVAEKYVNQRKSDEQNKDNEEETN